MSGPSQDTPATPADAPTDDDRRQKAAEINRKAAEAEWNRNKQRWIQENFPEKKTPTPGA
jgi:hypothetical protein